MVSPVSHYGLDQVPAVPGRANAGHRLHQHAFSKVSLGRAGRGLLGPWVRGTLCPALSSSRRLLSSPASPPHYRELSRAGVDKGVRRREDCGHLKPALIRDHFRLRASVSSSLSQRLDQFLPAALSVPRTETGHLPAGAGGLQRRNQSSCSGRAERVGKPEEMDRSWRRGLDYVLMLS